MLPYFATAAKLHDEIVRRDPSLHVIAAKDRDQLFSEIVDADGCISYSMSKELLEGARRLRWIQAGSAGIDHFFKSSDVHLADIQKKDVRLTKASGVTRYVIGEHVFAMILAISRNIPRAVRQKERRLWEIFMGSELHGTTLCIIGLGGIGERVAQLGKAFGMRVLGTKRHWENYTGAADDVMSPDRAQEVAGEADYLVLACSLNAGTRNLVTASFLSKMQPHAVLVNISRGEIICESDLVHALKNGVISAAALDTFGAPGRSELSDLESLDPGSELWTLPNVLIMPNNASATPKIYEHLADIVVANAARLRSGEPLLAEVRSEDVTE